MINPFEITHRQLQEDPHLLWRTFIQFLSKADTTLMNDVQMAAQLPFWYDSDIQKGGHLRYFENNFQKMGDKLDVLIMATLDALKILRADPQAEILARAADCYFSKARSHTPDHDELHQMALEGEFEKLDLEYHDSSPSMKDLLENYLKNNTASFVKVL